MPARPVHETRTPRAAWLALALLLVVVGAYLLHAGRGTTHFFDEWDWITRRRGIGGEQLLGPHNGHLSLAPVILYKLMLQVAGLTHYWLFRLVLTALHLGCAVLVFLLARSRVGAGGALFAAGLVAVLGAAGDDLLWAFQIGFLLGVLFGLGALLALDRGTRRGDVAAAVLLALSLASASVGAAFAIAVAVELAMGPRRKERWWVLAAPLALYAVWYLGYGEPELKKENLGATPVYAVESGATAAGGLFGLTIAYGRIVLAGLAAAVTARVWNADRLTPRLLALATAPVGLWVLTALSRAQFKEPSAPRYIYCGAVLLVLLGCELARGRAVPRIQAAVLLGLVLAFAAVANAHTIDQTGDLLRDKARDTRARLGALDLLGRDVDPALAVSPYNGPQIVAGPTLSAERSFGRPGLSPGQLDAAPPSLGAAADDVLRRGGAIGTAPATAADRAASGAPPVATDMRGGSLRAAGACVRTRSEGSDARLDLTVPDGDAVIVTAREAVGVLSRRFGLVQPTAPSATIVAGATVRLSTRGDAARDPWRLELASAGNLTVCRTRP